MGQLITPGWVPGAGAGEGEGRGWDRPSLSVNTGSWSGRGERQAGSERLCRYSLYWDIKVQGEFICH